MYTPGEQLVHQELGPDPEAVNLPLSPSLPLSLSPSLCFYLYLTIVTSPLSLYISLCFDLCVSLFLSFSLSLSLSVSFALSFSLCFSLSLFPGFAS